MRCVRSISVAICSKRKTSSDSRILLSLPRTGRLTFDAARNYDCVYDIVSNSIKIFKRETAAVSHKVMIDTHGVYHNYRPTVT